MKLGVMHAAFKAPVSKTTGNLQLEEFQQGPPKDITPPASNGTFQLWVFVVKDVSAAQNSPSEKWRRAHLIPLPCFSEITLNVDGHKRACAGSRDR